MFDFSSSVFQQVISIPSTAQVVFVSDMFVEDYVGGAELTSEALIQSSPFEVFKLKSKDLSMRLLEQGANLLWVFGNFTEINPNLIPSIVANLKYTILEYDYKYCRFRSPEKHMAAVGTPCDCHNQMNGKLISAFFYGAMGLWWMSEKQRERYHTLFPFLAEKDNVVLSSVFTKETLAKLKLLREMPRTLEAKRWLVFSSDSWIKGFEASEKYCVDNRLQYEVVKGLKYDDMLAKLASSEGLVYLPPGGDTCPRMVIEAKLLGIKLVLNDNVQHKDEDWFATDKLEDIEGYLYVAPELFWTGVKKMIEYRPTISGYTTTLNCVKQGYPFRECITSMLSFCDEVCIVDGGSTDGTWEELVKLAHPDAFLPGSPLKTTEQLFLIEDLRAVGVSPHQAKLAPSPVKLAYVSRDWSHPRFAVFDGMQKAEARKMCTKEFCWQMDSDEVVHEEDVQKIQLLARALPPGIDVISLPVTEFWGGPEKVRVDVQPWKWRLSKNKKNITHGIPLHLRRFDAGGNLYAAPGTDGCDMIDAETGQPVPHVSFYTDEVEHIRKMAMVGDPGALQAYEQWFNETTANLPGVFHYSWYDIPRKMRLYRDYWTRHWNSLYNQSMEDSAETNMMFDLPWSQVTEEMIEERASELKEKLGGWIWHRKWDGKTITPSIATRRLQPQLMRNNT